MTHIDALAHYSWQGPMYTATLAQLVTARDVAQTHSIMLCLDSLRLRHVTGSPVNPLTLF